jgi:hypothetical protein
MSPELERLLEAYHAKLTCPPAEKSRRVASFERLLGDALAKLQAQAETHCSRRLRAAIRNSAKHAGKPQHCRREHSPKAEAGPLG